VSRKAGVVAILGILASLIQRRARPLRVLKKKKESDPVLDAGRL
jgi:hypothetical protein